MDCKCHAHEDQCLPRITEYVKEMVIYVKYDEVFSLNASRSLPIPELVYYAARVLGERILQRGKGSKRFLCSLSRSVFFNLQDKIHL